MLKVFHKLLSSQLSIKGLVWLLLHYFKILSGDFRLLHRNHHTRPSTFACTNYFLHADPSCHLWQIRASRPRNADPIGHMSQKWKMWFLPRARYADHYIISHSESAPPCRLTEHPLTVQHLYLWPPNRVTVVTADRKLSGVNECLEKSGSMLGPAWWSFLTPLIEGLLL